MPSEAYGNGDGKWLTVPKARSPVPDRTQAALRGDWVLLVLAVCRPGRLLKSGCASW